MNGKIRFSAAGLRSAIDYDSAVLLGGTRDMCLFVPGSIVCLEQHRMRRYGLLSCTDGTSLQDTRFPLLFHEHRGAYAKCRVLLRHLPPAPSLSISRWEPSPSIPVCRLCRDPHCRRMRLQRGLGQSRPGPGFAFWGSCRRRRRGRRRRCLSGLRSVWSGSCLARSPRRRRRRPRRRGHPGRRRPSRSGNSRNSVRFHGFY